VATWSPQDDQLRVRVELAKVGPAAATFRDLAVPQYACELQPDQTPASDQHLRRPDKTSVYEAAYEKRFWDGAAAVLTFRHDEIGDVVDVFPDRRSPIPPASPVATTVFVEAAGSIGSGTEQLASR